MSHCPACGAQLSASSTSCPSCGRGGLTAVIQGLFLGVLLLVIAVGSGILPLAGLFRSDKAQPSEVVLPARPAPPAPVRATPKPSRPTRPRVAAPAPRAVTRPPAPAPVPSTPARSEPTRAERLAIAAPCMSPDVAKIAEMAAVPGNDDAAILEAACPPPVIVRDEPVGGGGGSPGATIVAPDIAGGQSADTAAQQ